MGVKLKGRGLTSLKFREGCEDKIPIKGATMVTCILPHDKYRFHASQPLSAVVFLCVCTVVPYIVGRFTM